MGAHGVAFTEPRGRMCWRVGDEEVFLVLGLWQVDGGLLALAGELVGRDGEDLRVVTWGCRRGRPWSDEYACEHECEGEPWQAGQLEEPPGDPREQS